MCREFVANRANRIKTANQKITTGKLSEVDNRKEHTMSTESRIDRTRTAEAKAKSIHRRQIRTLQTSNGWRV